MLYAILESCRDSAQIRLYRGTCHAPLIDHHLGSRPPSHYYPACRNQEPGSAPSRRLIGASMSAQELLSALNALYHGEPSVKEQANRWLEQWQQSTDAWQVRGGERGRPPRCRRRAGGRLLQAPPHS